MEKIDTDLVIAGSGAAGLCAALTAQSHLKRILLVTKGRIFFCGSTFVNINRQWGLTFCVDDKEQEILFNTINSISQGTHRRELSKILVEEAYESFQRLQDWGVRFQHDHNGRLKRVPPCFCLEPLAAILENIEQFRSVLAKRLDRTRVRILEETRVTRILVHNNCVTGLLAEHGQNTLKIFCKAAILTTGGNGASFASNIVEPGLIGDGYRLAAEVGIVLKNMEFQQRVWEDIDRSAQRFPFSALFDPNYEFRSDHDEVIMLPPSNTELSIQRRIHVPISNLQQDKEFDKRLLAHLSNEKPDQTIQVFLKNNNELVNKIRPHVMAGNGGIEITPWGETGIDGLFAAGEVTTGMHGGDRVGGTMIAATQVFGARAGMAAVRYMNS